MKIKEIDRWLFAVFDKIKRRVLPSLDKGKGIRTGGNLQFVFKLIIMEIQNLLLRYSGLLMKKMEIDSEISDIERKFNELANKC